MKDVSTYSKNCSICQRIELIKAGKNPYFILEMNTGYAVFADQQFFLGYVIFLSKQHATEIHELDRATRKKFLEEMSLVAEVVYKTFKPRKLNYELLGNVDAHLHWHIVPRHRDDPKPRQSSWKISAAIRNAKKYSPSLQALQDMKQSFLEQMQIVKDEY